MTIEKHDLIHDLPEHKETIHDLKIKDAHFARLFEQYHEKTHEIHGIEENNSNVADDYIEQLKHERAQLKDNLYTMILAAEQ